jgi:hypothetical protein
MLDNNTSSEKLADLSFSADQFSLAAKDPATLALTFLIVDKDNRPLNELYSKCPEALHGLLDTLLVELERREVIEITESAVRTKKKLIEIYGVEHLRNFLPAVFELAANKILQTSVEEVKQRKEMIQYYVLSDRVEITNEAQALIKEFKFKMDALKNKSAASSDPSIGHRMIGLYSYKMEMEDFV